MLASWLLVDLLAVIGAPARVSSNATPTRAVELLIGALLAPTLLPVTSPSPSYDEDHAGGGRHVVLQVRGSS